MAWRKGLLTDGLHRWIGANYTIRKTADAEEPLKTILGEVVTYVEVAVPQDFIEKMCDDLDLVFANNSLNEADVDRILGRAGRLAYLIPHVKPYVGMLWAAKGAADRFHAAHHRRTAKRRYPAQRFRHAATWIRTLLRPPPGPVWLPLVHIVTEKLPEISADTAPTIEYDASPWGFGAVLRKGGRAVHYFEGAWTEEDARVVEAPLGDPAGQTSWEYLALFLVLLTFATDYRATGVIILGDNISSLNLALELKGDKVLGRISREIAWRRIRLGWRYVCGHLPGEQNVTADYLSRLHAPNELDKKTPNDLIGAKRAEPPRLIDVWTPGL